MEQREITIINKLGLHARAAAKFVSLASQFQSEIKLGRGNQTINGKSIMGVMMLAASKGSDVVISANGDDEQDAIDKLTSLVADRFGEDE